ncbi:MAG: hypothetical protein SCK70_14895, partial [bacterium]|nr:hypothetical protein [bacterium]
RPISSIRPFCANRSKDFTFSTFTVANLLNQFFINIRIQRSPERSLKTPPFLGGDNALNPGANISASARFTLLGIDYRRSIPENDNAQQLIFMARSSAADTFSIPIGLSHFSLPTAGGLI